MIFNQMNVEFDSIIAFMIESNFKHFPPPNLGPILTFWKQEIASIRIPINAAIPPSNQRLDDRFFHALPIALYIEIYIYIDR